MSYANRMLHLPTSRSQQFFQLFIVASLAFSLGLAASLAGREVFAARTAVVAPAAQGHAVPREAAVARVPYESGWELYDSGWAGGPAFKAERRKAAAMIRVPYEAGWELYDDGWAGGPNTMSSGPAGR
jgi:hypothetical protein